MINISIITIGDELLIGQVIDTNSAWMAQELNKAGFAVIRRVAIGDNKHDILHALDEERKESSVILITGGLGPTNDDITKVVLCEYFRGKMIINAAALKNVKYLFEEVFKRPMQDINLKQAEVPDCCTVLQNKCGTAPGMLFQQSDKIFISMPGVPHEMKGMMEDGVIPFLKKQFEVDCILHQTLLTAGIGESFLAEKIKDFEESLPATVRLAYLPTNGMVRLRLTATGKDKLQTSSLLEKLFLQLQQLVSEYMVTNKDETLETEIAHLLIQQKATLALAESCTGGYISHLITSIPGSSAYFNGGVVSYSNTVKEEVLSVNTEVLEQYGAVSEAVAREMMTGVLSKLKATYAVAVTGIMGPGGGSAEKPVGTVWIAVGNASDIRTRELNLRFDRQRNIQLTAMHALNMLRKFMLGK
ncbi:MAG: competence/damage-inducible protein A [Niastella sp.]|nr:competence/damage-inducible protein A [Niastella sp.]